MSLQSTELTLTEYTPAPYRPSKEEANYLSRLFLKFNSARQMRERKYTIVNDRSMEEYWRDSERRWISYIPESSQKKPWQAKAVKPVTRNKCIGIIANLLSLMIEPEIRAQRNNRTSETVSSALKDIYEISEDLDQKTLKYLLTLVDAVSMGTAFVQEDYVQLKRKVKEIKKWNANLNKMEWKEKEIVDFEGFLSSIVSPYEVYLGNIFEFDMQKQPYFFRRTVVPFTQAKAEFGNYPNFSKVAPGAGTTIDNEEEGFLFQAQESRDIAGDDVEILRYQSRFDDEMAIVINGVLMTAVGLPIPYDHKDYNVVKIVFEPLSTRFAYGKSLPDKIQAEQDIIDSLYRMVIDKTFLSIFPPLLAKGREKITTDVVVPGKITPVDTESEIAGIPGISGGVGNEINILTMIEQSMDQSTLDPQHLGTPATGERTATQVIEAKAGAEKILGLFGFMIAFMIEKQADLRIQNILQFWAKYERMVGSSDGAETVKGVFEKENAVMRNGRTGTRTIEFLPPELTPTSTELFKEEFEAARRGRPMERIILDPEIIRDYKFHVQVKANPSQRMTEALRKALGLEFYDRFINNPLVGKEQLTRDAIRLFDKNPDELMVKTGPLTGAGQAGAGLEPEQGTAAPELTPKTARPNTQRRGNVASNLAAAAQPDLGQLINA